MLYKPFCIQSGDWLWRKQNNISGLVFSWLISDWSLLYSCIFGAFTHVLQLNLGTDLKYILALENWLWIFTAHWSYIRLQYLNLYVWLLVNYLQLLNIWLLFTLKLATLYVIVIGISSWSLSIILHYLQLLNICLHISSEPWLSHVLINSVEGAKRAYTSRYYVLSTLKGVHIIVHSLHSKQAGLHSFYTMNIHVW